jgi:orotate phosphoribosyltransferase
MVIKRGYDKLLSGQRVLVVEDILTTGQSARRTVDAVRRHNGIVVAVAAICNRGNVTAENLDVERLHAEIDVNMIMYPPGSCPLCAEDKEVNTQYGHGKAFLAERAAKNT